MTLPPTPPSPPPSLPLPDPPPPRGAGRHLPQYSGHPGRGLFLRSAGQARARRGNRRRAARHAEVQLGDLVGGQALGPAGGGEAWPAQSAGRCDRRCGGAARTTVHQVGRAAVGPAARIASADLCDGGVGRPAVDPVHDPRCHWLYDLGHLASYLRVPARLMGRGRGRPGLPVRVRLGRLARSGGVPAPGEVRLAAARRGTVVRQALLDRLAEEMSARLVVVVAPAGWGKTSLLRDLCAAREAGHSAWLSVDKGDNDPVRFWAHVIAALGTVSPGIGATALEVLTAPGGKAADMILDPVLTDMARITERVTLVLDDFHLTTTERTQSSFASSCEHVPPTCAPA